MTIKKEFSIIASAFSYLSQKFGSFTKWLPIISLFVSFSSCGMEIFESLFNVESMLHSMDKDELWGEEWRLVGQVRNFSQLDTTYTSGEITHYINKAYQIIQRHPSLRQEPKDALSVSQQLFMRSMLAKLPRYENRNTILARLLVHHVAPQVQTSEQLADALSSIEDMVDNKEEECQQIKQIALVHMKFTNEALVEQFDAWQPHSIATHPVPPFWAQLPDSIKMRIASFSTTSSRRELICLLSHNELSLFAQRLNYSAFFDKDITEVLVQRAESITIRESINKTRELYPSVLRALHGDTFYPRIFLFRMLWRLGLKTQTDADCELVEGYINDMEKALDTPHKQWKDCFKRHMEAALHEEYGLITQSDKAKIIFPLFEHIPVPAFRYCWKYFLRHFLYLGLIDLEIWKYADFSLLSPEEACTKIGIMLGKKFYTLPIENQRYLLIAHTLIGIEPIIPLLEKVLNADHIDYNANYRKSIVREAEDRFRFFTLQDTPYTALDWVLLKILALDYERIGKVRLTADQMALLQSHPTLDSLKSVSQSLVFSLMYLPFVEDAKKKRIDHLTAARLLLEHGASCNRHLLSFVHISSILFSTQSHLTAASIDRNKASVNFPTTANLCDLLATFDQTPTKQEIESYIQQHGLRNFRIYFRF